MSGKPPVGRRQDDFMNEPASVLWYFVRNASMKDDSPTPYYDGANVTARWIELMGRSHVAQADVDSLFERVAAYGWCPGSMWGGLLLGVRNWASSAGFRVPPWPPPAPSVGRIAARAADAMLRCARAGDHGDVARATYWHRLAYGLARHAAYRAFDARPDLRGENPSDPRRTRRINRVTDSRRASSGSSSPPPGAGEGRAGLDADVIALLMNQDRGGALIVETFLRLAPQQLGAIQKAAVEADADQLELAATLLWWSCGEIHSRRMADICQKLVDLGRSGSTEGAQDLADALLEELEAVRPEIEALPRCPELFEWVSRRSASDGS